MSFNYLNLNFQVFECGRGELIRPYKHRITLLICRIFICALMLLGNAVVQADELADLLQQGQENLAAGYYREAENQFSRAELKASASENAYSLTLIKALQGYMAAQRQHTVEAEALLTAALAQSKQNQWHDLTARIDLYLGQLFQQMQNNQQATDYFQQAVMQPEKVQDKSLLVSGFYQLANLAIENNHSSEAWQQLQQAKTLMKALPVNHATNSQLWLNIGYQNLQLYRLAPQDNFLAEAFTNLNTALTEARQAQHRRTQAAALKHLAALYKQQQRTDEAIKLLLEGISLAQREDADDLLIDLEWQIGQLYQQHNPQLAIAAYRRAVKHIDTIRIDIPVSYQKGRSSFRDTFAPLYLALADLLLQQSVTALPAAQQTLLAEAQDSIEKMKKSELEDYFQSRCDISATPINLKKTDLHAAALYPISLPDRLELIVYTAQGLYRFSSPVTAKALEQQAREFSSHLRNYDNFSKSQSQAQLLHSWILAPALALLKQQQIETLIYMPDGALRLLPLAALHDGKKFVIEEYAVVTSPGMSLIDSDSLTHQNRILLAGVSLPGNVVSDLPDALLTNLVVTEAPEKSPANRTVTRDLKRAVQSGNKRELTIAEQQEKTRELRELLKRPVVIEKLQQMLALPGVDTEIKQLANQSHSNYLLNESFSLEHFTEVLKDNPHDILHIASHGFFGSTAENSFIMTHNKILNLNQLEVLLSSDYFKRYPIDLLTLSACQTAEGDDRSPLGIGGVAIKAKVHSALGSLWPVADEATAQLMTTFYQSLNESGQTKAKALQQAMLTLLKQKSSANPSFWSPFILIGNWI